MFIIGTIQSYFHTPSREELNSSIYITWAGHRICTSEHKVGPRILNNYKIVFIIKGRGTLVQEDRIFYLRPGDVFVLFPEVKHFYYADPGDPWELMWVSFNGNVCREIIRSINLIPEAPVIVDAFSQRLVELLKKIINNLGNENEPHALKSTGYLYLLFSEMLEISTQNNEIISKNKKEDIIEKALAFIELNYYNCINVDVLCKHVNYSRSYFSRLFKEEVRQSIPDYINNVRIQKARLMLKNTDLNINGIAKSVGFDDQFYFSKIFKKVTGLAPASYKTHLIQIPGSPADVACIK